MVFNRTKRNDHSHGSHSPSIISADMTIVGDVKSTGEVHVDGKVNGDVTAHHITIGEKSVINGEIICDSIRLYGKVEGTIRANEVSLSSTAHVIGDIHHSVVSIEAGAFFNGSCHRITATEEPQQTDTQTKQLGHNAKDANFEVVTATGRSKSASANGSR